MTEVLQHFGLEAKPFDSDISYVLFLLMNWPAEMNLESGGECRKSCHFYRALTF